MLCRFRTCMWDGLLCFLNRSLITVMPPTAVLTLVTAVYWSGAPIPGLGPNVVQPPRTTSACTYFDSNDAFPSYESPLPQRHGDLRPCLSARPAAMCTPLLVPLLKIKFRTMAGTGRSPVASKITHARDP